MVMLGSQCSPCCDQGPCPSCEPGASLPDTVTVSFSGPQGTKAQGPNLLPLEFLACFGSGATGFAEAPGGRPIGKDGPPSPDSGPIYSATLTSPGSGYAKLGREEPTLTLANTTDGAPAEVSISLSKVDGDCNVPHWKISSISVTKAGTGYTDNEPIVISIAEGDTEEVAAIGFLDVDGRAEPTLEASTFSGSGATFSVAMSSNGGSPETWGVSSVTASGVATGYIDGEYLYFFGGDFVQVSPAQAKIAGTRIEPVVSAEFFFGLGVGAVLGVTLTQGGTAPNIYWSVSSVSIDAAGSGYEANDIGFFVTTGQGFGEFVVTSVDGNGGITGLSIVAPGEFYDTDGTIAAVVVEDGGAYYAPALSGVTITNGGRYYRENAALPAIVSDVTVTVRQGAPAEGDGAAFSATVNSDTSDPNFGKLSSVSVTNGGDGYLGWRWVYSCDCNWVYNPGEGDEPQDRTVVCWRTAGPCIPPGGEAGFPECQFLGYQCWPRAEDSRTTTPVTVIRPCLVRLRLTSTIKTEDQITLEAPIGVPGIDNGPVTGVFFDDYLGEGQLSGWAYLDENGEVVAPEITAEVFDTLPSQGSGATASVVVNLDKNSENFGDIQISITDGGGGYLSGVTGWSPVVVTYPGPDLPPTVRAAREVPDSPIFDSNFLNQFSCDTVLTADAPVECGNFSFTASFVDQTAAVQPGGDVASIFEGSNRCCGRCYVTCLDRPTQVAVTFRRQGNTGYSLLEEDNLSTDWGSYGSPFEDGPSEYVEVDCPEHEVEVVFDLLDIEEAESISIECSLEEELPHLQATVTEGTNPTYMFVDPICLTPPIESTGAGVELLILANTSTFPAIQETQPFIRTYTSWRDPGRTQEGIPLPEPWDWTTTKTYTLRDNEGCVDFPASWEVEEQRTGGPSILSDDDEPFPEPGTLYRWTYATACPLDPNFGANFRRICYDYDIDIEFS
jgi:hypothetical protein